MIKMTATIILCVTALFASEPKVVKLVPPQISSETISEQLVCTRPMREGKFNISVEQSNDKSVVNCYGHGGSGWTTLFGSVNKAIELFEATNPTKDTPIRVIGSGCMGMTSAIELTRLGYNVAGITTAELYEIPSWKAAGYFALVSIQTSPEEQANLDEIGVNTFLAFQTIERDEHPYISKDAVRFMPVYGNAKAKHGVEMLEARGLIPPREYVTLDFGNGVVHPNFVKFMTYFMNTTTLMRQLNAEIARLNIPVEMKKIDSFDQVAEEVVFNCSGLGGRSLNNDDNMVAVRGHLITLNENSGSEHMDYMLYSTVKQNGNDAYIYMFPKNGSVTPEHIEGVPCVGVLGGTFIPNVDKLSAAEQAELDAREFELLIERNREFFHGKKEEV